jgi:uncharacterized coiled-coil DUF342 family protein
MNVRKLSDRIDELTRKIEEARLLRLVASSDGWKQLEACLQHGILARINEVCQIECDANKTLVLRAEIKALRWFLRIPQITDKDLKDAVAAIKDLRGRIERIQSLGLGRNAETEEVLAEADRLNQKLEGVT